MLSGFIIMLFFSTIDFESTTESIEPLLLTYEESVNSSLALDKSDRQAMRTWFTDFQVQQVNLTAHYRLAMLRHKDHNFQMIDASSEWQECIGLHRNEINNSEKDYYTLEGKCLNAANAHEGKDKRSVHQVEKEIKKWRKTYKYLVNLCKINHPGDEYGTGLCLVEYMKRDNYYATFERLILLKLESMSNLSSQLQTSLRVLEDCLKGDLSQYLGDVRVMMTRLNQCYTVKNKRV